MKKEIQITWPHDRLRPPTSSVLTISTTSSTCSSSFLYQSIDPTKSMRNQLGMVPESLQFAVETGVHWLVQVLL